MTVMEIRAHLRALASALPEGAAVPVPRDWVLSLTESNGSPEALLNIDQAAARIGVPVAWLYRNAKSLPFTRKLSRKQLRFDPAGLDEWLAKKGSGS